MQISTLYSILIVEKRFIIDQIKQKACHLKSRKQVDDFYICSAQRINGAIIDNVTLTVAIFF